MRMNGRHLGFSVLCALLALCLCSCAAAEQAGDELIFGRYEQDHRSDNGPEPIQWLVLETQGDEALLISRYVLDTHCYHEKYVTVTWETCSLRAWLNSEFFSAAFTPREQQAILLSEVDNSQGQHYPLYRTDGGRNTQDRLYLLSYAEAWRYFSTSRERCCAPTAHAKARQAYVRKGYCWWWLRSPGVNPEVGLNVFTTGSYHNCHIFTAIGGVRPVMRVSLSALQAAD